MFEKDFEEKQTRSSKLSSLTKFFVSQDKENIDRIVQDLSPDAKELFKVNIQGLLGSMPSEFAETFVSLSKENLQQLLYSAMATGYAAKSIETRLSLQKYIEDSSETK